MSGRFGMPGPEGGIAACFDCPGPKGHRYSLAAGALQDFPAGIVRRIAPVAASAPASEPPVDEARRNFLKLVVAGGAVALAGGVGIAGVKYLVPPPAGAATYPNIQLHYDDGSPILVSQYKYTSSETNLIVFNYPLTNEPNMLLNLGTAAPNGVGPSNHLVAYSAICQHLGCVPPYISYYPAGACGSFHGGNAFIHCVCHGSTYDPAVAAPGGGANLITGPAQHPLPQVLLHWDPATDYLYAVGVVGPPVRGHSDTLLGGSPVTAPLLTEAPQTPTQQCPT